MNHVKPYSLGESLSRFFSSKCQAHNKQLQRTVTGRNGRGACASLHYAHAPRWTRGHAAAELRR